MEIKGKIIKRFELQQGISQSSGKEWKRQSYILETFDNYPKKVFFSFFGNRIDTHQMEEGDEVSVKFDIESRSYVGRDNIERWSTDIIAWDAELLNMQGSATQQPTAQQQVTATPADKYVTDGMSAQKHSEEENGLPF